MNRSAFVLAGALLVGITPVSAQTVWTDWVSSTAGVPGLALGTLDSVSVRYEGEVLGNRITNGGATSLWGPGGSFMGGNVTASPASEGDMITLNGSYAGTNRLMFDTPVINPVLAIWSLGQPGRAASFTFDATPTLLAGGPNATYGGQSISVSGNTVRGAEGNGVVQFTGAFSGLSWTHTPEHYYGFTVGMAAPVPEPSTYALLLAGLGILWVARRSTNHA